MAEDLDRYLSRIESQHRLKPKFMSALRMFLTYADGAHGVAKDLPLLFYVKQATGDQLDIIGKYIGRDRRFPLIPIKGLDPDMPDDTFRVAILAKIVQNQWDGTNESFIELWNNSIGDILGMDYVDNQDMTINVNLEGTIEPRLTEMILGGYIIPKPGGVGFNVELTEVATAKARIGFGFANGGKTEVLIDYEKESSADVSPLISGAKNTSNMAHIRVGPDYQREQKDSDTVRSGTMFVCSNAHYAVEIK